jgi:hypothetical protein
MRKKMRDEGSLRRELDFDLEEHLFESELGFELDHPLVRELQVRPDRVAYLNELYRSKFASSVQAMKDGDWCGYIELHERPHRICAMMEVIDELDDQSYWELLAHFWIDCENAWQKRSEWRDLWNSCRPEKQFVMNDDERGAFAFLPDELTVYRGLGDADTGDGLSWTLGREMAVRFARRSRGHALITAVAEKRDVHAFLNRRKEQEIVVENVRVIGREILP